MARQVQPTAQALATEQEVQRFVWRQGALAPDPAGHTEEEQDVLCAILNAVSDAVAQHLGGVVVQHYTERHDGGQEFIRLRRGPVVQVQAVRELGQPLTAGQDYALYPETGMLRRLPALEADWWPPGSMITRRVVWAPYPQAVEVEYDAGWAQHVRDASGNLTAVQYAPGGEGIRAAVLMWCHAIWAAGPSAYGPLLTEAGVLRAEGMPPQVERMLAPYRRPVGALAP